ncbi:MAG: FkbM family methyltransferase [Gammaproteobacteria bacterium]|nr:FkbM family methyltransferase [Gammaproteobacteria bacterium]
MLPRASLIKGNDDIDYLLFSTKDAISSSIYFNGVWAPPLLTISQLFYADIPAPFIMDIGANLGAYSIPIAKEIQAQGGIVYAYEPQRIIYYQLCGNVFINRLENLFTFCKALGEKEDLIKLPAIDYNKSFNIGGFTLDESIRNAHIQQGSPQVETVKDKFEPEIPMIMMDNIDVPSSPCLIKIDVEWLEFEVLSGGKNFLRKHGLPPILFEASADEGFANGKNKILGLLRDLGYEDFFSIGNEVIAQSSSYSRFIKFNQVADGTIQMIRQK